MESLCKSIIYRLYSRRIYITLFVVTLNRLNFNYLLQIVYYSEGLNLKTLIYVEIFCCFEFCINWKKQNFSHCSLLFAAFQLSNYSRCNRKYKRISGSNRYNIFMKNSIGNAIPINHEFPIKYTLLFKSFYLSENRHRRYINTFAK